MKRYRNVAFFLLIISLLFACKKDPKNIGIDLIENNPLDVEYSDTTFIVAHSVIQDSLRTDEISLTLLGSVYDPVFGITTGNFYTQICLSTASPDFGTNPQCDSVLLTLTYSGYYGDTSTIQTLRIYELLDSLRLDTVYYSQQTFQYDPTLLGEYTFTPRPSDSVWIDSVPYAPHIRFMMNTLLGDKILSAPASALESNTEFKKYIRGIYIESEPVISPGEGAILYTNFLTSLSKITLYYKNEEEDSLVYTISINNLANACFAHYDHNNYAEASPDFINQVINGDTTLGSQKIYLQGMGGIRSKIILPNLKQWENVNKTAINEAQLILYNDDIESDFNVPQKLSLFGITETGKIDYLIDEYESEASFDGNYYDNKYRFRITRHLQSILAGEPDYGLYLMIPSASITAQRVIIGGHQSAANSMVLRIIYTKAEY